jgi:hypothetical protein
VDQFYTAVHPKWQDSNLLPILRYAIQSMPEEASFVTIQHNQQDIKKSLSSPNVSIGDP